jgi:DNA polymerase alpha subunit B
MPMFPPPPGLPLDSANSTALELPCTPDVLVLPSDLQPFAKLVPLPCRTLRGAAVAAGAEVGPCAMEARDTAVAAAWPQPEAGPSSEGNVVCINPGRLTKGTNGEQAIGDAETRCATC